MYCNRKELYCNLGCVVASDCIARDGELYCNMVGLKGLKG